MSTMTTVVALLREHFGDRAKVEHIDDFAGRCHRITVQNCQDLDRLDKALDEGRNFRDVEVRTFRDFIEPKSIPRHNIGPWAEALVSRIESVLFWGPPPKPLPRRASEQTRRSLALAGQKRRKAR